MAKSNFSTRKYQSYLKDALVLHDADFASSYPQPTIENEPPKTPLENAINYLWLIWLLLGVAGGLMSLPHTLQTAGKTVHLSGFMQTAYALVLFFGLEIALIAVKLVTTIKKHERGYTPEKTFSLLGLLNSLIMFVGFRPVFDVSHLSDKKPGDGAGLIFFLFLSSLTFNLIDTLSGVSLLAAYSGELVLVARVCAGLLAPILLLVAGGRFADEVVRFASRSNSALAQYARHLQQWEGMRRSSWELNKDEWLQKVGYSPTPLSVQEPLTMPIFSALSDKDNGRYYLEENE